MRSVEVRCASRAFMASVRSARICSVSLAMVVAPPRHPERGEGSRDATPLPSPGPSASADLRKTALTVMLFSRAMALDLPALLRETGALLAGHFRLSSG